jgi:hypothetical protein
MSAESPRAKQRLALAGVIVGAIFVTVGIALPLWGLILMRRVQESLVSGDIHDASRQTGLLIGTSAGAILIPLGAALVIGGMIWRGRLRAYVPPPLPKAPSPFS